MSLIGGCMIIICICTQFSLFSIASRRRWADPSPGDLRLRYGNYSNQGLLEIYCGEWGTVCDDSFYEAEAEVACRQLGYNSYVDYDHLSM